MATECNTDLKTVLFPVELRPVFLRDEKPPKAVEHDTATAVAEYRAVPRFLATVDLERNHTFAVVSESYRLVANAEAVRLGRQCFRQVFRQETVEGMEVYNIIMPKTRSFCHIDFIHRGHTIEPWGGDKWGPYLRITNSYNRTKPLRFDLGFCRWICTNGMIFGRENIILRYYHSKDKIGLEDKFEINFGRLKDFEDRFVERMRNLKSYAVPRDHLLALVCKALGVKVEPADLHDRKKRKRLFDFRDRVVGLTQKYTSELGSNGYGILNIITDLASRPSLYISQESMVDPLQKRCGDWVSSFLRAVQYPKFDYLKYLGDFTKTAEALSA